MDSQRRPNGEEHGADELGEATQEQKLAADGDRLGNDADGDEPQQDGEDLEGKSHAEKQNELLCAL